ncbi:hypothetical protein DENSPDRAFT_861057 [Dentipellis sp. KUC8613]|nr:hypothetical protein DENSPDRAFT_861057 [Dentipellis sp. KUC8613]
MTMAPRIEVYTQLACRAVHHNASSTMPPIPSPSQSHSASVFFQFSGANNASSPSGLPSVTPRLSPSYSAAASADFSPARVHLPDLPLPIYSFDECSADPKVQARAARIQASVKTTESILSAITTGWLSHLGDVYGRKKILSISIFGALFMDFVYILVSDTKSIFSRHGEAFIIAAPLIEGILGAQSTYNGITHAYATDCTPDGSRARIFSTMQGMLYVGLASGPWLNGLVLNVVPYSNTTTLFGLAILIALMNFLFVVLILPESLTPERRTVRPISVTHYRSASGREVAYKRWWGRKLWKGVVNVWTQLVRPIALFKPQRLEGRRGRDWNLTLVGAALFIYVLSILGYYMSLLWVTRAINLLLILPAVLTYFAPKRAKHASPNSANAMHLARSLQFDQRIAAISFFTDASANALVALSPTSSQALFIMFTSLNSLTSGGNPALHSLGAVSLQAAGNGGEFGLVFGALGLVNAVAHIIAPAIYAAIYGATVAEFPKAIFVMSAILLYIAVCMLVGIRPFIHTRADAEAASAADDFDPRDDVSESTSTGRHGEGSDSETETETEREPTPSGSKRASRQPSRESRGRARERPGEEEEHERARRASVIRVSISEEGL